MTAALDCTVECDEPLALVHFAGRLTDEDLPTVRSRLFDCLAGEPDVVVLDMTRLGLVSPTAARAFGRLVRQASQWPGSIVVFAAPPRAFLAGYQPAPCWVYPSVEAARSGCSELLGRNRRVSQRLAPAPAAATQARHLVGQACRRWGVTEPAQSHAELVVTELVANAVRHAGTPIDLSLSMRPDRLQISVRDRSTVHPVPPDPPDPDAESGRGLMLVASLCSDCGSTPITDGKIVWATVGLPGEGTGAAETGGEVTAREHRREGRRTSAPPG